MAADVGMEGLALRRSATLNLKDVLHGSNCDHGDRLLW